MKGLSKHSAERPQKQEEEEDKEGFIGVCPPRLTGRYLHEVISFSAPRRVLLSCSAVAPSTPTVTRPLHSGAHKTEPVNQTGMVYTALLIPLVFFVPVDLIRAELILACCTGPPEISMVRGQCYRLC